MAILDREVVLEMQREALANPMVRASEPVKLWQWGHREWAGGAALTANK